MTFIDIVETNRRNQDECPRRSSFGLEGAKQGEGVVVIGNLPHGYEWQPATAADRDRLTAWLCSIQYPGAPPLAGAMAAMLKAMDNASPDEIKDARRHAREMGAAFTTALSHRRIWRLMARFMHACRH